MHEKGMVADPADKLPPDTTTEKERQAQQPPVPSEKQMPGTAPTEKEGVLDVPIRP